MQKTTFAQRVAAYLDQYKAANPQGGQFISVDPDGDGKKQAIFVTDSGKVNPKSDSPGYWSDFKQGQVKSGKGKKQERDSPGQLGTFDDPFTGKFRRKPEKQRRLDDSTPQPEAEDAVPDWLEDDEPEATKRKRLPPGFRDRAVGRFLPEDATKDELLELLDVANDVVAERTQQIQAGQDALRQVFGDATKLTGAQSKARAASDVSSIPGFDEAVAELESSGGWKNDQSSIHDLVAYLPPGSINWARGSGGEIPAEQVVLEALRMPLPQPPKPYDMEVLSEAYERMAGTDQPDERSKEERDRDKQYSDLMRQANEAADEDDWQLYDDIKTQIAELFPETVSEEVDDFSAMTFRDAVARYAGQLGLWDDEFTGKFRTKGDKQERLFDGAGKTWKDQPRKKKGEKGGGQWTKGSSPTTPKMEAARAKLQAKQNTLGYDSRKSQRRKIRDAIKKYGTREELEAAEPGTLTQQEWLLARALKEEKKRLATLNGKTEGDKFLQRVHQNFENESLADVAGEWWQGIQNDRPGFKAAAKRHGLDPKEKFYSMDVHAALPWLGNTKHESLDQDMPVKTLAFWLTNQKQGWMASEQISEMMKEHRRQVMKAVKRGEDVPEGAYEKYRESPWVPADQREKKKKSVTASATVEGIKQTDTFRLRATLGRKLKTAANKYVDKERKKFLAGYEKMTQEIDKRQEAIDEFVDVEGKKIDRSDYEAGKKFQEKYLEMKQELSDLRDKQYTALTDWIKTLPSNRRRAEGKPPAINIQYGSTVPDHIKDRVAKAVQTLETWSGGALADHNVSYGVTKKNRSFARGASINMNPGQVIQGILLHELGHTIDSETDQGRKTKAFEAAAIQKHKTRWVGGGCEADEVGSKNGFMSAYTGKYYNAPDASEVLSMGIQALHEKPVRFAKESPDHFNFTIASLRGLL